MIIECPYCGYRSDPNVAGRPYCCIVAATRDMDFPREGIDFCVCGAKYWDGDRCHSCGVQWVPPTSAYLPDF